MTLRCKVDYTIDIVLLEKSIYSLKITYIGLYEGVVGFILYIFQVSEVTRICQFIEVDDILLEIFIYKETNYMASNKTCTARDKYIFHLYVSMLRCERKLWLLLCLLHRNSSQAVDHRLSPVGYIHAEGLLDFCLIQHRIWWASNLRGERR